MHVSKSFMLYEGEDFTVRLEYNENFVILHLPEVNKFDRGVLAHMKVKIDEYWEFFSTLGYNALFAAVAPEDKKINKLLGHLGFVYGEENEGLSIYYFIGG